MEKKIKKNGVVLDSSDYTNSHHVLIDNNIIYSCTLNQTNIKSNNNKFYILQLLESDSKKEYLLYTRYGRIGNSGVSNTIDYYSKDSSIAMFEKTFKQKTGNWWQNRDKFEKKSGKYFMSQIDYEESDSEEEEEEPQQETKEEPKEESKDESKNEPKDVLKDEPKEKKEIVCTLDKRLQELLSLISNINIIKCTMKEFNIDLRKMPLGKISKTQIKQAYDILKAIADGIDDNLVSTDFENLTSEFYTLIPSSFGRNKPPIICDEEQVKKYVDMLGVLTDLEIAGQILKTDKKDKIHPLTKIYWQMNVNLTPLLLDPKSGEYQMIHKYVNDTAACTHNWYTLELLDVMKVYREEEHKRFQDYGNNQLLFHGSRVVNFVGILSQGLRINSNAPKTGSMFGPGSYFSNSVTKSANYCYADSHNSTAVMLLCEVSLGEQYKKTSSEYITWLPNPQYQSTWGMGESTTNPKETLTLEDGLMVPNGKLMKNNKLHSSLLYDEFIVYKEDQIKIRYALKLKFNYKH